MISEKEFIFYIKNSCVSYEKVENKKGLKAFKYLNDLGIALYFYYENENGILKHYDDHDTFISDLIKE